MRRRKEKHGGAPVWQPMASEEESPPRDLRLLVTRAGARDESSFERLYDLIAPVVYGLSLRILENESSAEENVVDVFSRIWEGRVPWGSSEGPPLVEITAFTRVCALERLRAGVNVPSMSAVPATPPGRPVSRAPQECTEARAAIEAVPAELREPLEMAYFRGLTAEEIGERLLLSPRVVQTRIGLGMIRFRAALGPVLERRPSDGE
ncbi:MAG: sigma factor-like helix-turn-helix DNA-binding protein [Acidobacteriota bacterium]